VTPRHLVWILAASIAASTAAPARARAHNLSYTTNFDGDKRIESCSDLEMRFWSDEHDLDGIVTARRSQTLTLGADARKALKVEASDRGGVRVQPSTDGTFSALICMSAGATSNSAGEKILDQLSVQSTGGVLRVNGPDGEDWAAIIVLSVPDGATLDMSASNGPLQIGDVEGRFTLRTTNGPIKLSQVRGVVDARATNGPIKFTGHAGDVMLSAQNGPIELELDAVEWKGKRLDASTQNGPIKVVVPDDIKTGVDVTGSRWSPIKWNGATQSEESLEDGARRFHFGGEPTRVRVSTVNGPMKIFAPAAKTSRGIKI
jgi:hypothetical protein